MVVFEFDNDKSQSNLDKHGIDFLRAQALWNDTNLLEIPAKTIGERRNLVIAALNGKCWTAVITYRKECLRIISVRRSRKEEVTLYESF